VALQLIEKTEVNHDSGLELCVYSCVCYISTMKFFFLLTDSPLNDVTNVLSTTFISLLSNVSVTLRCRSVAGLNGLLGCRSSINEDMCRIVSRHILALFLTDCDASVR
jgi:hypothetical protein